MGCAGSTESGFNDPQAAARNKASEDQLSKDRQALSNEIKLLILGTGESGNSTICKQMTILHSGGFTERDRLAYREIIYSNTVHSLQAIIDALPLLNLQVAPSNEAAADKIFTSTRPSGI